MTGGARLFLTGQGAIKVNGGFSHPAKFENQAKLALENEMAF